MYKTKFISYSIFFIILPVTLAHPQSLNRLMKDGEKFFENGNYSAAVKAYLKADSLKPDDAEILFKTAMAYLKSPIKKPAQSFFEKAYKKNPIVNKEIVFWLARANHLNQNFDAAIVNYKKFLSQIKNQRKKELARYIYECENGKKLVVSPVQITITNMGKEVNTPYPEYIPLLSVDGMTMIFTSRRPDSKEGKIADDGKYFEDIYTARHLNNHWETAVNISSINTAKHDAAVGLSVSGQKLFIYYDKKGGDIYIAEFNGEKWSIPSDFGEITNTEFFESSARLSANERELYFVSDRTMGIGGKDIYMCSKNINGTWSKAKNLGKAINTEYDEESPYPHPDGKSLYFSSRGHDGMGGFDIFKTEKKQLSWSKPENIGYPLNSSDDDLYFTLSANKLWGYYSSVKEGGFGDQDLYIIKMPVKEKPPELILVKGVIKDAVSGEGIEAEINITDNKTNEPEATLRSNPGSGSYLITLPAGKNYGISVQREPYLFFSENFTLPEGTTYKEYVRDILLNPMKTGNKIILKNIFFDTDKTELKAESTTEVDRLFDLLIKNSEIKVKISGHTDDVGDEKHNQVLSEQRAQSVVKRLIEKGITENRLQYAGYGESKPISDNKTEEGRQMNRRTEFEIVES
ncbi:MAG: hypothetical protein A3H98_10990 [Bacteroidetes bacterium RIFCSPLOWO2_02_FULL_36_8]|nr:MAG: hypothetical protein A3H98_10990 [Bacteroidetes bacterium RIFCSPLOWO2_02_FULL_36_8]OFY71245.1 MAG: hypothetical protein A3G23_01870 [Bacteroidetes bacterium RIFCSPLOWO2_12_FULL_37_12]